MEFVSLEVSYVGLHMLRYASAIACYLVIFNIALIECSLTVNNHTTALDDILTNAPLSQIEPVFGWMFCQRAEFSELKTQLELFTFRQMINEVSELSQAIDDKLFVFLVRCRWAYLQISLDRLL